MYKICGWYLIFCYAIVRSYLTAKEYCPLECVHTWKLSFWSIQLCTIGFKCLYRLLPYQQISLHQKDRWTQQLLKSCFVHFLLLFVEIFVIFVRLGMIMLFSNFENLANEMTLPFSSTFITVSICLKCVKFKPYILVIESLV